MNTFLITFEILPPSSAGQEEVLANGIKTLFNSWARPTSKIWLIKTYLTRKQVIDYLKGYLGPNDRILVMLVNNDWIAINLHNEVVNWMKSGL